MSANVCGISKREFPPEELIPLSLIRPKVASLIREGHPELDDESTIHISLPRSLRFWGVVVFYKHVAPDGAGRLSATAAL